LSGLNRCAKGTTSTADKIAMPILERLANPERSMPGKTWNPDVAKGNACGADRPQTYDSQFAASDPEKSAERATKGATPGLSTTSIAISFHLPFATAPKASKVGLSFKQKKSEASLASDC
jgi:hypothetical protein